MKDDSSRPTDDAAQPAGVHWRIFHPTETITATQLVLGRHHVLELYWHLPDGYKRTAGRTIHKFEDDAKKAALRRQIGKRAEELKLLSAELLRLNQQ